MEPTSSLGKTLLACLTALIGILTRSGGIPHDLRFRLYDRIRRTIFRLDRLTTKFLTGKLPKPRPPRATNRAHKPTDPHMRPLPRGKRWVVNMQQMTALFGYELDRMLHTEDFKALLAAAPQAGRLMRPLVQMFHMPMPEHLQLPARPKPSKPAKPTPEPLVINPNAHVPWGLGYRITRRLKQSGFTIAPRIPKIQKGF